MTAEVLPMRSGGPSSNQMPPPHNVEAEQCLLGALLVDNSVWPHICSIVETSHFFEDLHRRIFEIASGLISAGQTISPITIRTHLGEHDLGGLTTSQYLARLAAEASPPILAVGFAKHVRDLALRRMLLASAQSLEERTRSAGAGDNPIEIAAEAIGVLQEIAGSHRGEDTRRDAGESAAAILDRAKAIMAGDVQNRSVSTGIPDLDRDTGGGFAPGTLWIVAGRPGMGKEQPVDTPVLTPNGWRQIGSLQIGDQVISIDGSATRVIGVFPQGVKQSFRITFRDNSSTECGEDHLWLVAPSSGNGRDHFRTMPLREIIEKGLRRSRKDGRFGEKWRIPIAAPAIFDDKELPIDPYVLGVLIGDGATSHPDVRFSNPDFDADIRTRVADRLPPDVHLIETRSGTCPYLSFRGPGKRSIREKLAAIGLNVKSGEKSIPEIYKFGSIEQRLNLLRGLMDTDGSCTKQNSAMFYTTSNRLALDVADLARSLGALVIVRSYDRSAAGKPIEYVVNIKSKLCPFYTARKKENWSPQEPSRYIYSVEPVRMVEQVCIAVDHPSHLYLTNDFIVTHNTLLATGFAKKVAAAGVRAQQNGGQPVGAMLFSLEVPEDQLIARILADLAYTQRHPISFGAIMRGELDDTQMWALWDAQRRLERMPLTLDVAPSLSVQEIAARIRAEAKRMAKRGVQLSVVLIDYLKFVRASDRYKGNRVYEVGEISGALKQLSKELGICIVLLAQLNRALESRDRKDKRPLLSDLRDSGDLEADADVVVFIHREAYYVKQSPEYRNNEQDALIRYEDIKSQAELIIGKSRVGQTGTIEIWCDIGASTFAAQARGGM